MPTVRIAQDAAADELLGRDPLALLIGMLLDQHVRQRSSKRDLTYEDRMTMGSCFTRG
jgi:hypothetical protein